MSQATATESDVDAEDEDRSVLRNLPEGIEQVVDRRHLLEEYRYGRWPSIEKFKKSRASEFDIGTLVLAALLIQLHLRDGLAGFLEGVLVGILVVVAGMAVKKVYKGLFTPLSGERRGKFQTRDPTKPFWVAEIDCYTGTRANEYHRKFVHTTAPSQPEAIAAIRYEHNVTDDDVIYIRRVEPKDHQITDDLSVRGPDCWIDPSDDPIKAYTTWQFLPGSSMHSYNPETGQRTIVHSVAGISSVPYVYMNDRTYTEMIAHLEIHELVHWGLEQEEQPTSVWDEVGWDDAIWGIQDYINEGEQPDGPWYDEERRTRIELTSREQRETATERIPHRGSAD